MSYILDALKKSEEERKKRQEKHHSPYTTIKGRTIPLRRRKIVPGTIITTFLLLTISILAGGWWFSTHPPEKKVSHTAAPADEKIVVATGEKVDSTSPAEVQTEPRVREIQPRTQPDSPTVFEVSLTETEDGTPLDTPDGLPSLSDLPFAVKSMLPEMEFRGHVYSPSPDERMIMINSTVIREGDLFAPELTLKEITETGLIMEFRETMFQVELF